MVEPVRPSSPDEEILGAETSAIVSLLDDEARVRAVGEELRAGFSLLAHVGRAVSVFGSARTPRDHPEYQRARLLAHSGQFEAATTEQVWLWQNMLDHQPSLRAVRLSPDRVLIS